MLERGRERRRAFETEVETPMGTVLVSGDRRQFELHGTRGMDLPLDDDRLEILDGTFSKCGRHPPDQPAVLLRPLVGVRLDTGEDEVGLPHDDGAVLVLFGNEDVVDAWTVIRDAAREIDPWHTRGPGFQSSPLHLPRPNRLRRPLSQKVAVRDQHRQIVRHVAAAKLDLIQLGTKPVGTRCHRDDPAPLQCLKAIRRECRFAGRIQVEDEYIRIPVEGGVEAVRDVDLV